MKELHALKTSALAIAAAAALAVRGAQFSASAPASVLVDGEERPGDELIAREPKCRVAGVAEPTGCPDFTVELPRAAADAVTVFAVDFGLDSASDKNATAINCALAEAKRVGAARVELAPGTYRCFDEPGIVIDGFRDFTFDGKGAVLVFRRPPEYRAQPQSELVLEKGNCLVRNCERTLVEDFTMDWDWECDPIGAFVRVVNRSIDTTKPEDSSVDLKFVDYDRYPLYPSPVPFQKVIAMDECRTRFRTGPEFSYGQTEGHFGAKNEWVSPNVLRVWPGIPMEGRNQNPMTGFYKPDPAENLSRVRGYEENGFYRIQHCYYGKNAINLSANRHLTICDVTVWSCFGMAMVVDGAQESWQVERFRVVPPSRDEFAKAYPGREYRPRGFSSHYLYGGPSQKFVGEKKIRFADYCKWMNLRGKWISGGSKMPESPAPVLERRFVLDELPRCAMLNLAVAGWHEVRVNSTRVGSDVLSPVTCQPDRRISAVVRGVAQYLKKGNNTVSVLLGNGWFNCFTKAKPQTKEIR